MTGDRSLHDPGSVLIEGREIVAVGSVGEMDVRAGDAEVVDATGHAVIPGLQNCHLHSGLLRGTAESKSLWDWLKSYVDPAHRALTPEIAEAASLLAYTEGLRFGPRTVIAHCVWLDDREIALLAETGTGVSHCPCSNMKLSSGPARVADLRAAEIVVGLGSDGE